MILAVILIVDHVVCRVLAQSGHLKAGSVYSTFPQLY